MNGRDRRGTIERLARVPRPTLVPRIDLEIAPGKIVADRVAEDVPEGFAYRDVAASLADRDDELDFVMELLGAGRIRDRRFGTTASAGLVKKNGGSRVGSFPISRACAA